jgi:hypothetical protein
MRTVFEYLPFFLVMLVGAMLVTGALGPLSP